MPSLFSAALAPVCICAFYIYIRDRYEKEPVRLLLTGILFGAVITVPIIQTENAVTALMPLCGVFFEAVYLSFAVAAPVEEMFKFVTLFCLTWRNRNLNERFDGIVYAVFIALGFAAFENILYVFHPAMGGMGTAFSRAVFSVPAHGFFGVMMGYYFAMARFEPERRMLYLSAAFFVPWAVHGLYDCILLLNAPFALPLFVPFVAWLWLNGLKKIRKHITASPFKPMP